MAKDQVMTVEEIEREIKQLEYEQAQIALEETRERVASHKAAKEVRSRQNRQRQGQLRADHTEKAEVMKTCTHRQGGSPGRERKGAGPSALRVVHLPDERVLVMCANCPMRVFSPLPSLGRKDKLPGETAAEMKQRLDKFTRESKEFEELMEQAQNQLTPEAAAPMHCGKQFKFIGRSGNQVIMPAPCDDYAQGRDNRQVTTAA